MTRVQQVQSRAGSILFQRRFWSVKLRQYSDRSVERNRQSWFLRVPVSWKNSEGDLTRRTNHKTGSTGIDNIVLSILY